MQSARLPAAAERPELREAIDSSARLTRFASAPGWAEQSDAPSEIGAWVAALLDDWWEDVDEWSRGGLAVPKGPAGPAVAAGPTAPAAWPHPSGNLRWILWGRR